MPLIISYSLLAIVTLLHELFFRKGKDAQSLHGGKFDQSSTLLGILYWLVCLVAPWLFNILHLGQDTVAQPLIWIGVILVGVGGIIRLWAAASLGRFYSRTLIVQKEHNIVTKGPYKRIRHPGYLGSIFIGLGLGLASGNLILLLTIMGAALFYFPYRIHNEEKMLLATFDGEYKKYQERTRYIFPFVY